MKSREFYEKLWLKWKVVIFMKGGDLSEKDYDFLKVYNLLSKEQ